MALVASHGERVLETPHNTISMAVTLSSGGDGKPPAALGAALWVRLISGCRLVASNGASKKVGLTVMASSSA